MIGKLISKTIKVATLPLDAGNAAMDMLCGGSGSKEERTSYDSPGGELEKLRDRIAEAAEQIDED